MMEQEFSYKNHTDVVLVGIYRRCLEIGSDANQEKTQVERELVRRGLEITLAGDPDVSIMDERLVSDQSRAHALGLFSPCCS